MARLYRDPGAISRTAKWQVGFGCIDRQTLAHDNEVAQAPATHD